MIRHVLLTLAVTLSVTAPSHAYGVVPSHDSLTIGRGEIRTFLSNPYARKGKRWNEIDAMAFEQDRIWTGETWLPLNTHRGAQFLMQIEREIRAGTYDSE